MAKTLFDKVWERHVVDGAAGEAQLIYIDLQMIHEVTSPQAFEGLRMAGRSVRRPEPLSADRTTSEPDAQAARLCRAGLPCASDRSRRSL